VRTFDRFAVAVVFVFTVSAPTVHPQNSKPSSWNGPLTPDGQPDVQGYFMPRRTPGTGSPGYDIEIGAPEEEGELQSQNRRQTETKPPDAIIDPPDGRVPYQPWAAAVRDENRKNSLNPTKLEHLDSLSRCLEMGVPRQNFFAGFDILILQKTGYVVMVGQNNSSRSIPLDGRPHIAASIHLWSGDSVGHWEGNTLVVDVSNINEHAYYDWAGNFHSSDLHLVERWTFVDSDTIKYEVTNYDPKVFTQPWTMQRTYVRNKKPVAQAEQFEDDCYEGEKDVNVMLQHEGTDTPK
jgi:hypothetical protein